MILERLYLKNFKRFRSLEIKFSDGITGIVGNNGTGKSSIVEAILLSLFGVRTTGIETAYIVSSSAGDRDKCQVELTFNIKGNSYTVSRSIGPAGEHTAKIYLENRILAQGVNEVAREVKRIIGLSPEDFKNTIYAGQKDLMSLLSKNPGKRKEWFSRVLGIDHLKIESNVILKSEIDETIERAARIEGKLLELDKDGIELSISELRQRCVDNEMEFASTGIAIDELGVKKKESDDLLQLFQEKAQKAGILSTELNNLTLESKRVHEDNVKNDEIISSIESNREEWDRITRLEEQYKEIKRELELLGEDHITYTNLKNELTLETTRLYDLEQRINIEKKEVSLLYEQVKQKDTLVPEIERRQSAILELTKLRDLEKEHSIFISRKNELVQKLSLLEVRKKELIIELNEIQTVKIECNLFNEVLKDLPIKREQLKDIITLQSLLLNIREWQSQATKEENELISLKEREILLKDKLKGWMEVNKEKEELVRDIGIFTHSKGKLQSDLDTLEKELRELRKDSKKIDEIGEKGTCPLCKQELGENFQEIHKEYDNRRNHLETLLIQKKEESINLIKTMGGLTEKLNQLTNSEKQFQEINIEYQKLPEKIQETENRFRVWKEKAALEEDAIQKLSYPHLNINDKTNLQSEVKSLEVIQAKRDQLVGRTAREPGILNDQKRIDSDIISTSTELSTIDSEIASLCFNPQQIINNEDYIRTSEEVYQKYIALESRTKDIPVREKNLGLEIERFHNTELKVKSVLQKLEELSSREDQFIEKKQEFNGLAVIHNRYQELEPLFYNLPVYSETKKKLKERSLHIQSQIEIKESILNSLEYNPDLLTVLKETIERLHLKISDEKRRTAALEERISQIKRDIEEKAQTLARIENYTKEHHELTEQIRILRITRTAITNYVEYLMNIVQKNIESDVGSILGIITDGKYEDVILDPDFTVLVHDLNGDFPVERFSGGEQDDIAVALRIALSRYIAGMKGYDESTFLIFDEIFGSQDEERRSNLITAMRSLEQKFPQILLISHIPEVQNEFETTLLVEMTGDGVSCIRQVSY